MQAPVAPPAAYAAPGAYPPAPYGAPGAFPPATPDRGPEPPVLREDGTPRWPWWTGILTGLTVFFGVGLVLALILTPIYGEPDEWPFGANIAATFVQDLSLILVMLLFARLTATPRAWHFGLRGTRFWPAVGWTLLALVAFWAFSFAYALIPGVGEEETELPTGLDGDHGTAGVILLGFTVCVLAPVTEELFFRGFLFTSLRRIGVAGAAVVSGVIFGLAHAGSSALENLPLLSVLGIVLALLYWRTNSIYPPIALHALNNCIAFGVTQDWGTEILVLIPVVGLVIAAILVPVQRLWPGGPPPPRGGDHHPASPPPAAVGSPA